MLLDFYEAELAANPTGAYTVFDTRMGYWLLERGVQSLVPYRQYGEHGGLGNPEHDQGWRAVHRADSLHARLSFYPAYACGSALRLAGVRLWAWLWAWLRLAAGRTLHWRDLRRSPASATLRFAAGRLLQTPLMKLPPRPRESARG
jgi:hypothetical protein